jgi:E3 ubiquitin-protein ligase UBR4
MLDIFGRCSWDRSKKMVDLLASFLGELGSAAEASTEFVDLFNKIISQGQWKYYLAFKGVLQKISNLITIEIDKLNRLEMVTLNADLAQGFALKTLTDLLSSFVDVEPIKMTYKTGLVSTVLHGYLSLRRLVVQRTKLIDQTQEKVS